LPAPGAAPVTITITSPTSQDKLQAIGHQVTFKWTYSSNFGVMPKYLNICAVPESWANTNQNYTIVNLWNPINTTYVWDTSKYTNPQLIEGKYTLYIYDERGPQNTGGPGRLQASTTFSFSMYSPGTNIPISEFHCTECSIASKSLPPFIIATVISIISSITLVVSHFYSRID
ncbi:7601_t:CDS:2, partial [Dentiscutata heterogama]